MTGFFRSGFEIPNYPAPFNFTTGTAGATWETTGVRANSGAYWYKCASSGSTYHYISHTITGSPTELYIRAAVKVHATTDGQYRCLQLHSNYSGEMIRVWFGVGLPFTVAVDGTVRITTSVNGASDTWHLIELYAKLADAGTVTLKIDGTQVGTWNGDTKKNSSDTGWSQLDLGTIIAWGTGFYCGLDDVAINDTAGSAQNSWCGDGRTILLHPNANGTNNGLTGSDGNAVDNFEMVDEVTPDDDTTYVSGDTVGQYELYGLTGTLPSGAIIHSVRPVAIVREETADGDQVALGIKAGVTTDWGDNQGLLTTYQVLFGDTYLVNPDDSAAWEQTDIDDLQAGVKLA